jgi:hypothetical protein
LAAEGGGAPRLSVISRWQLGSGGARHAGRHSGPFVAAIRGAIRGLTPVSGLEIVRVYTKAPGKEPERDHPFTLRRGDTVLDVARLVHKDIAASLRYARLWGSGVFDGQQVGADHEVADGDVVELHAGR